VATLRTSGTEPKLKYYVELAGADPVATRRCVPSPLVWPQNCMCQCSTSHLLLFIRCPGDVSGRELDDLVEVIIHEMLEPEKHGLRRPKD
jgi:hypothetical protein